MGNPSIASMIEHWLVAYLSEHLNVEPKTLDVGQPFANYGFASIEGISLVKALEDWLQRPLSPTLAWDYPSIESLTNYLADTLPVEEEETLTNSAAEPIAIIGVSCRYPGAPDLDAFWQLLKEGRDAITEVPSERWDVDEYYDPSMSAAAKMVSRWGGFIDNLDQFDAPFFYMSPREAAQLDPRQRLLLETAWEALEDAGIPVEKLAGSKTGVFTATLSGNYASIIFDNYLNIVDAYSGTGGAHSVTANRLSYIFDLHGPSLSVDTACSGSLVALHLACQSIRNGESSMAIAGGSNIILKPDDSVFFSKTGALSSDGRCKVFDSRANGIVRSEGVGLVILKPLSKAVKDGDKIYAVIRGSVVNQDGRSNGILAPNSHSQEAMLREAYKKAGIDPSQVQYIEAHGTGTALGDPIEVKALGSVLGQNRSPDKRFAIGSVKTNIGHTEAAAGITGVIKVLLAMKHRQLPPSLHFEEPNPLIPFDRLPLYVQQELSSWPQEDQPLIAGVSAFGFAGTNAHVILEEAPRRDQEIRDQVTTSNVVLLPISARNKTALHDLAQAYKSMLEKETENLPSLYELGYNMSLRRSHLEHRLAIVANSHTDLKEQLDAYINDEALQTLAVGTKRLDQHHKLAFVFSGQGSHWIGMGQELLQAEPVFRATLERCDSLLREYVSWSLIEEISAPESESRLNDTDIAQPAIFALQVALAALWRSWGVTPKVIIGQSLGEVAAAHVAGALSLEHAVKVIYHRSRLMKQVTGQGKTAVVGLPLEQAKLVLTGFEDLISVAGSNSHSTSVLSGDPQSLERILKSLERQGVFCRMLKGVDIAFHSPQMDPLKDDLVSALSDIQTQQSTVPIFSTVSGKQLDGTAFDAEYWGRNLRDPFLFSSVITELLEEDYASFLEVSPHPVLVSSILEDANHLGKKAHIVSSLRRSEPERSMLMNSLGQLYVQGIDINWSKVYPHSSAHVSLPFYAWQRERYWFDQLTEGVESLGFRPFVSNGHTSSTKKSGLHPLLGEHLELAQPVGVHVWESDINASTPFYLQDHQVQGTVVLPGSAYIEMALSAIQQAFGSDHYSLRNIEFKHALVLPTSDFRRVEVVIQPEAQDTLTVHIYSRVSDTEDWTLHATASCVRKTEKAVPPELFALQAVQKRCDVHIPAAAHYAAMLQRGLHYGPTFQSVTHIWRRDGEALGKLELPSTLNTDMKRYLIHPALLDACFQVVAVAGKQAQTNGSAPDMRLPVGIRNVTWYDKPNQNIWCHVHMPETLDMNADVIEADLYLRDLTGHVVVEIKGLQLQRIAGMSQSTHQNINDWIHELIWQPKDHAQRASRHLSDVMPLVQDIYRAIEQDIVVLDRQHNLEVYQHSTVDFDRLATIYVVNMFLNLGWNPQIGEIWTTKDLINRFNIIPSQQLLFERMLSMLKEDNYLEPSLDGWKVINTLSSEDADIVWERQMKQYPESDSHLILLKQCGEYLTDALQGKKEPLQLLFGGDASAVDRLYTQTPHSKIYNALIVASIREIVANVPAHRSLRILEIGAGTGGTSTYVLPHLPSKQTQYTYTDVSRLFLNKAEEKFSQYDFINYQILDIEQDPLEQGFVPQSYDIILASNVLHATKDIRLALTYAKSLLAPSGKLILLESPGPQRWMDTTFGLTNGWWRFTDHELRPHYPLISAEQWVTVLNDLGFADARPVKDGRDVSPEYVILAEVPRVQKPPQTSVAQHAAEGSWLILADKQGIGYEVAHMLKANHQYSITVTPAEKFMKENDHTYQVNPANRDDFLKVFNQAFVDKPNLKGVIHLWSLNTTPPDTLNYADIGTDLKLTSTSMICLIQAMIDVGLSSIPRLWCVTKGAQSIDLDIEPVRFNQASIWGLGRVLFIEHPEFKPTLIDLDPTFDESANASQLFQEVWEPDNETQLGFRDDQRYVLRFVQAENFGSTKTPLHFRSDASYIITGGLSGIGLETAHWMVKHGARHLILLNRTPLPARSLWTQLGEKHPQAERVKAVRELEACGVTIHVGAVDIGDESQLSTFLSQYQQEGWPTIRGVIHSAGLIKDQLLMRMDQATFDAAIQPKIYGAWLLHSLLEDVPLDFFVLFSSGSSLMGMIGQSNYAAGNAFMDALSYYRRAKGLPSISINWGLWADVGIIARSDMQDQLALGGIVAIKPEQGMRLLGQILQQNPVQIAPMPADKEVLEQTNPIIASTPLFEFLLQADKHIEQVVSESSKTQQSDFLKELMGAAPSDQPFLIETYLQELVAGVLRINRAKLDKTQPLNMLGLDSIMAVELKNRIEASVGVSLSIVELLQGMSVAQLADKLHKHLQVDDELSDILDELEQLSIDEIQSMLDTDISA